MSDDKTIRIADRFAAILRAWLRPAEFEAMQQANAREGDDSSVCHSHDYCDANMAMAEAFEEVAGHQPSGDDEQDSDLWNAAWNDAKRRHLRATGTGHG